MKNIIRRLPDMPRAAASADVRRPEGANGERILLADDNADMRDYVRRLLAESGYEVEAVADGLAALDAARARKPDLVLTDVMMPGLDGFGLLRELRADAKLLTVPILLLSARAGQGARIEGMHAGADDYLIKPFSARELLARVEAHLKMARLRHETAEALRLGAAQFETLLSQAPLGVFLVDADFRIREVNPAAVPAFGAIPGGVVGRDFREVMHILWNREFADQLVAAFRETLETGASYVNPELAEYRADRGTVEYYDWRLERILLPDALRSRSENLRENDGSRRRFSMFLAEDNPAARCRACRSHSRRTAEPIAPRRIVIWENSGNCPACGGPGF